MLESKKLFIWLRNYLLTIFGGRYAMLTYESGSAEKKIDIELIVLDSILFLLLTMMCAVILYAFLDLLF